MKKRRNFELTTTPTLKKTRDTGRFARKSLTFSLKLTGTLKMKSLKMKMMNMQKLKSTTKTQIYKTKARYLIGIWTKMLKVMKKEKEMDRVKLIMLKLLD